MNLSEQSIKRAIEHIKKSKDTDLFPMLKEFDIFFDNENDFVNELKAIDIGNYNWQTYRRFIIPKDEVSYRIAVQLDPIDTILYEAIIFEFGSFIENKRIPVSDDRLFSYRFAPTDDGQLYDKKDSWKKYWNALQDTQQFHSHVVYIDIADFYNRIYHHTLENLYAKYNLPNQIQKALKSLMQKTTQTISQGIPVGPHASHLLAEMCLIEIDEFLIQNGYEFCRYSDDIYIFADDEIHAQIIIYQMAKLLDTCKLTMQRNKTKIYNASDFYALSEKMLQDDPINELEQNMNDILYEYSDEPYGPIEYIELSDVEQEVFSEENLIAILNSYMEDSIDYSRIRWFYRRLSKVGVSSILNYSLENINILLPAINDMAMYFISVSDYSSVILDHQGKLLLELLDNEIIQANEFFQLTISGLFAKTEKFNNIKTLLKKYTTVNDYVKREIIFAAYSSQETAWVKTIKQDCNSMSEWCKRALIIASSLLQKDERKFYLQTVQVNDLTTKLLIEYIKTV